ncbi:MAG TPA: MFS transporter [Acidobacteriota bacterium]|nr:MFS transporter [Acidobacteriota bacterium]
MDAPAYSKKQVFMAMASIFMGYFVYAYFMQTLNNATPRIAADLNGMAQYSWSVSIPSLGLALGMILSGKLSDIYGRRSILLGSLIVFLLGTILSSASPGFSTFIGARTIHCLGQGAVAALSYAIIGDMFVGSDRSKWIGLLNIPFAAAALFGPTLSGWMVDALNWRHIFWWSLPLFALCLIFAYGMPSLVQGAAHKIDVIGAVLIAIAASTLIFGLSFAGTKYPWGSIEVIGLLVVSVIFGVLFLQAESKASEPFFDPNLLKNRVFVTASVAGFLSFFGMMAVQLYYPLFMQGIQGISAMKSGQVITPLGLLMSIIGVPIGFLVARTKKYKWMFVLGYALVTLVMFWMIAFDRETPAYFGFVAASLSGLALGAMPTINTIVIQAAVPRRLLGVATSALMFSVAMGMATAPAILGSAMNIRYTNALRGSLPPAITQTAGETTMKSLGDPRVLLSESAMHSLRVTLTKTDSGGDALFQQTVDAIRASMESGLRIVFVIAAVTMLLAFLLILTIPVIPLDPPGEEKRAVGSERSNQASV